MTETSESLQEFVIVYHRWWMQDSHFEEEVFAANSAQEAERHAAARCHHRSDTFNHWDYHVVKAEVVVKTALSPRCLTLMERIKGVINDANNN